MIKNIRESFMSRRQFFFTIFYVWFVGPGVVRRSIECGVILLCLILGVEIQVYITEWNKLFIQALTDYDYPVFREKIIIFFPIMIVFIMCKSLQGYLVGHLSCQWRVATIAYTRKKWLDKAHYYAMDVYAPEIDHPDQRFTQDIKFITENALNLCLLFIEKSSSLIIFSIMLWDYSKQLSITYNNITYVIPGLLLYLAWIYAALGTLGAFFIGRSIVPITIEQEKREATLRYSIMRFIENAQSIALSKGEQYEGKVIIKATHDILINFYVLLYRMILLNGYTSFYSGISSYVPIIIVSPFYFTKVFTLGLMMQINSIFDHVNDCLSQLTYNFNNIFTWLAALTRLYDAHQAMDNNSNEYTIVTAPYCASDDVKIYDNNGNFLCQVPDFSLQKGEKLLIRGPSGCGKSTFLRTLAGLHPHYTGTLSRPKDGVFIPASMYLPIGSLHDIVCYPHYVLQDKTLQSVLDDLQLTHFSDLMTAEEFPQDLISIGEKQRLMLTQTLLCPSHTWLYLDEPTAHLNSELAHSIMQKIFAQSQDRGIIIISHDNYPEHWFDKVITFTPTQ